MEDSALRVLLVDDQEAFVALLAQTLHEEYGYETVTALSGREGIQVLQNDRRGFDVILLDYFMPEVSGLNVLQWMHEQKNETPAIILTGAGSENVAVEAMKLGAYDYVRKELLEIQHLDLLLKATHERHLFRIDKLQDEERTREILLNNQATDKLRDIVNAIAPSMNSALATLTVEIESLERISGQGPTEDLQASSRKIQTEMARQLAILEKGLRGLLGLYQLVYAHHSGSREIDRLLQQLQPQLADSERKSEPAV